MLQHCRLYNPDYCIVQCGKPLPCTKLLLLSG
jgi:hypothetical protein